MLLYWVYWKSARCTILSLPLEGVFTTTRRINGEKNRIFVNLYDYPINTEFHSTWLEESLYRRLLHTQRGTRVIRVRLLVGPRKRFPFCKVFDSYCDSSDAFWLAHRFWFVLRLLHRAQKFGLRLSLSLWNSESHDSWKLFYSTNKFGYSKSSQQNDRASLRMER